MSNYNPAGSVGGLPLGTSAPRPTWAPDMNLGVELNLRPPKTPGGGYDPQISNPKDLIGSNKIPLHLWPETASALGSLALLDGALKYGRSNFREIGVRSSIYFDAARRHLQFWFEGEDNDPDSGLPHLSHALACLAILVDAQAAGKLNDDRMVHGGYRRLMDSLTPHVADLKARHGGKNPKHYTIADNYPNVIEGCLP